MRRVRIPTQPFVSGSAFDGRRPLRIVLDEALRSEEAADLLNGFAAHERVETWSTAPHEGVGGIELEPYDAEADLIPYRVGNSRRAIPFASQWTQFAEQMQTQGLCNREDAHRLLLLAQIATDIGADVLATRSPLLLDTAPRGLVQEANPMPPEEGVAVMGLYLRLIGDFTVYKHEGFTYKVNRGLWYWVLTRDLLASGWRWFSACVTSSGAVGDDELIYLGQSTLRRFDRVLRARDRLLQQFQLPANNDSSDEAIFYLDVALVMLSGALDAAARVAHLTYGIIGELASAGWRRAEWREKLKAADDTFAPLLENESRARDVMDLVGLLRNTIHGAALQGIAVQGGTSTSSRENLVRVPESERHRLLAAMDRRGGREAWGVRPLFGDEVALEPDLFIESLIPAAADILNELMDATNVGLLEGVDESELGSAPDDPQSEFAPEKARLHRLLAGLT